MPFLCATQDKIDRQIEELLDKALTRYKEGKYTKWIDPTDPDKKEQPGAAELFEEALQKKPNIETMIHWINKVGKDVVAGMINTPVDKTDPPERIEAAEKLKGVGHRIFEIVRPTELLETESHVIIKYIQDLAATELEVYNLAMFHLRQYGPYAMKFLIPLLNDKSEELKARVIYLITQIGRQATLALAEALNSKVQLIQQNAAVLLGNIKDERAIPALKRLIESKTVPLEIRDIAEKALTKITKLDKTEWKTAAEYYLELAKKYYYSHTTVLPLWDRVFLVWKWDPDKDTITERKAPSFAYNEQLAEDALYSALELNPSIAEAWHYLILTSITQVLEGEAALKHAEFSVKHEEITKDQLESLRKKMLGILKILDPTTNQPLSQPIMNITAGLAGRMNMYGALVISLNDRNYDVAKVCLEFCRDMGKAEDIPPFGERFFKTRYPAYGIVDALSSEDRRVRYVAAEAVLKVSPREKKLGYELVIANLVDAMSEMAFTTGLMIYQEKNEEDTDRINKLKAALYGANVMPTFARDEVEGMVKAHSFPLHDVIFIQYKVASKVRLMLDVRGERRENVFDSLRDDVRTKHIPKFVICDTEKELVEAKKLFAAHTQNFILFNIDSNTLKGIVDTVFTTAEKKAEFKARAVEMARRAVEAVGNIDPESTVYPYKLCLPTLLKLVDPKNLIDMTVRIPALKALGALATSTIVIDNVQVSVIDAMLKLSDKSEDQDIRLSMIKALGNLFRRENVAPTEDQFKALKGLITDGNYYIEVATAEAVGKLVLTDKQRGEVALLKKLKREAFTADELKQPPK